MSKRLDASTRSLLGSAPLFAALGDETRLRILARLADDGPMSIAKLTSEAGADVTRQAVSKHLRVLLDAGLVTEERRGRESAWQLKPQRLDDARIHLDRISKRWDEAIDRLKAFVEEDPD